MLLAPGLAERSLPERSYGTLDRRRSLSFFRMLRSSMSNMIYTFIDLSGHDLTLIVLTLWQ